MKINEFGFYIVILGWSLGTIIGAIAWKIREWKINRNYYRGLKKLGLLGQDKFIGWKKNE